VKSAKRPSPAPKTREHAAAAQVSVDYYRSKIIMIMEAAVSTQTAVLQALRQGPGYGLELARRVESLSGYRPAFGSLYPALEALTRGGFVRAWKIVPGGQRGGRSRTYYELTYSGLLRAQGDAYTLRALVAPPATRPAVRPPSPAILKQRLTRVSDLIAFTEDLRSLPRGRR
jgi:Transcriptional regulator PadR-like family